MKFSTDIIPEHHEDLANAWTIPSRFYTDESIFEKEVEAFFVNSWVCVAHVSEASSKNSFIRREMFGESLVVVRGRDSVLRGFYNVCPHRGHQLISEENGKTKNVITCPYHTWAFKLDGELVHATNCENVNKFEKDVLGLSAFHVVEYAGFIFINLSKEEPNPIEEQLPGLEETVLKHMPRVHELKRAARFVSKTPANWKSIVDNYIECYHCPTNHVSFASSVDVTRYTQEFNPNWTLQIGHAVSSEQSFKFNEGTIDPKFLGYWLWPCTMFNMPPGGDFMTVIYEFPISANETLQFYEIYFFNEVLTDEQKKLVDWYENTFRPEDLRLVESVQKGLKSRGYRGQGRIMTCSEGSGITEEGLAYFHKTLANRYLEEGGFND